MPSDPDAGSESPSAAGDGERPVAAANPDHQQLAELEAELEEVRAELEEYQTLLQDLPGIYEEKFRHQVRSTVENIRDLLDERQRLKDQVSKALASAQERQQLPAAEGDPAAVPRASVRPRRRSRLQVSLPAFLSSSRVDPGSRPAPEHPFHRRARGFRSWRWALAAGCGAVAVVLIPQLSHSPQQRPAEPLRQSGTGAVERPVSSLKLLSRGGQSWVLIENLSGGKVLDVVLNDGDMKDVPIGDGLRIRSGRPDLLYLGIGSQSLQRLGGVNDLDWTEIRPPI